MKDSEFKMLNHQVGDRRIAARGEEVAIGYKPDLTVVDERGNLAMILESGQKTDRKAFLGDFVKAEKYAESSDEQPTLIIVMQEYGNTTVRQISEHLMPYVEWLTTLKGGKLNLKQVLILSDAQYRESIQNGEAILSQDFKDRCVLIDLSHPDSSFQRTTRTG